MELPRPAVELTAPESGAAWKAAQGVFQSRCVPCHACYDAPCQLKLGTFEGIERGASEAVVYETRLKEAPLTRLEIDAHDAQGWRAKGFHPVLPEPGPKNLLIEMLTLKHDHPVPPAAEIAGDFTFQLDRKQSCTTEDHFADFAKEHPLWGMPYALPGLSRSEEDTISAWVVAGTPHAEPAAPGKATRDSIEAWEAFLNESPLKSQLAARYIYEHLFLASLYFKDVDDHTFFRLVRSRTPGGTPVDEFATRRPFDDPGARVYYRLVRRLEPPLEKTHMPYPLSPARLKRFTELFLDAKYTVEKLPGYTPEVAANPFRAFAAIPAKSRYRFMLEEAEFTMMGFIKGPVCRGQVALNVIDDRFWITFLNPDVPWMDEETAFLSSVKSETDLPAEAGSSPLPAIWLRYATDHPRYVKKKIDFLERMTHDGHGVTLNLLWDGDGDNTNAALTVFRHFDSATVARGLIGDAPKTAWVVDYPLLERIHYLLVAGFDVYGNVDHQLTTRLYMDFLRMEGESNFLMFLPSVRRGELAGKWYRDVNGIPKKRITRELTGFHGEPNITYRTRTPEAELFSRIETRLAPVLAHALDPARGQDAAMRAELVRLHGVKGLPASLMPEISFVTVVAADGNRADFTILRDSAHSNVAHLFNEDDRRRPGEDELTVLHGLVGAYPNALFEVPRADFGAFVDGVTALDGGPSFHALRERFGVLRASEHFWSYSDQINDDHARALPIEAGRFDYSRLEPF